MIPKDNYTNRDAFLLDWDKAIDSPGYDRTIWINYDLKHYSPTNDVA